MEVRPIDANAVTDFLDMYFNELRGYCVCNDVIANGIKKTLLEEINLTPTLDYAPVVHAKWTYTGCFEDSAYGELRYCTCSHCKTTLLIPDEFLYCPECGAKMDLQEG